MSTHQTVLCVHVTLVSLAVCATITSQRQRQNNKVGDDINGSNLLLYTIITGASIDSFVFYVGGGAVGGLLIIIVMAVFVMTTIACVKKRRKRPPLPRSKHTIRCS